MNEGAGAGPSRLYLAGEIALVLLVLAVLVQAVPLSRVLDGGWSGRLYSIVRTLVVLGFIAWLLARTGHRWRDLGLRRPDSWPRAIGWGAAGFVIIFLIDQAVIRTALAAAGFPGGSIGGLGVVRGNLAEYLYWAVPMSLFVAGFGEEMVGRAYLISRFDALIGRTGWAAALSLFLSSAAFGLGHAYQGIGGIIGTGAVGFCFGLLYLAARRNIWPVVIAHALTDVFGFTMIYLGAA